MQNEVRDRRINGAALESIMQDVLQGMSEFTRDVCRDCSAAGLEILAIEDAGTMAQRAAQVLPFPATGGDLSRD
ncbi:MAG: hypothetical protein R3F42_00455 [Pseudomonadota bacterium]